MVNAQRYDGHLAAFATAGGPQFVVARWTASPVGAWNAIVVAEPDGVRRLIVETEAQARDVQSRHDVDAVSLTPVTLRGTPRTWHVHAGGLDIRIEIGRRTLRSWPFQLLPNRVKQTTVFAHFVEQSGRLVAKLDGRYREVHATGSLRDGTREFHCPVDEFHITEVSGSYRGTSLGQLANLSTCGFGFSDPPPRPALTQMTALRKH